MRLEDYRMIFIISGLIGVLLIASPALSLFLRLPSGQPFSEIFILGPEQTFSDYPYNVTVDKNYSIYLGVGNKEGASAYYTVVVKFRNQTEPLPNINSGTPSPIQSLYEYSFSLQDGATFTRTLTFSVDEASFSGNQSLIKTLTINDAVFEVNKQAILAVNGTVFYYQLFFELWTYNSQSGGISYNGHFVDLQLNLTQTR